MLIFTDIASTHASFSASQDDNLIIDLADGDRVTIERYFENGRYYVIEEITFSDSVSFGVEEIDALVVA
ncbi:MAG: calcium-binding protein [Pseudomonadota bacterium]